MSTFDDFHPGDRVAHISLGDGTVQSASYSIVVVRYDNKAIGQYDRRWFELHPRYLFHRLKGQAQEPV